MSVFICLEIPSFLYLFLQNILTWVLNCILTVIFFSTFKMSLSSDFCNFYWKISLSVTSLKMISVFLQLLLRYATSLVLVSMMLVMGYFVLLFNLSLLGLIVLDSVACFLSSSLKNSWSLSLHIVFLYHSVFSPLLSNYVFLCIMCFAVYSIFFVLHAVVWILSSLLIFSSARFKWPLSPCIEFLISV